MVEEKYRWVVEQLRLCKEPASQDKLMKVLDIIIDEEGNESEKHGAQFCLYPKWAVDKALEIIEEAKRGELFAG